MNNKTQNLQKVALRHAGIYFASNGANNTSNAMNMASGYELVGNLIKLGYTVNEGLLKRILAATKEEHLQIFTHFKEVMGINKNWTPLFKGNWGEKDIDNSFYNHFVTFLANIFGFEGTELPCGHTIPDGTFNLEDFNGCPFCGTVFSFEELELKGQGTNLKVLRLMEDKDMQNVLINLLSSNTALDATQQENLKLLLDVYSYNDQEIAMVETRAIVVKYLVDNKQSEKVSNIFKTPKDVLRYVWFEKTGNSQLVKPKTAIKKASKIGRFSAEGVGVYASGAKNSIKLKYDRPTGRMISNWVLDTIVKNGVHKSLEIMHPNREMWVRVFRAIRFNENVSNSKFGTQFLNEFYSGNYKVWEGLVDAAFKANDCQKAIKLLSQRAGSFARKLFAAILKFGAREVIHAFKNVLDKVPTRLVFTLAAYAKNYFNGRMRVVKPLGGVSKTIGANQKVKDLSSGEKQRIIEMLEDLCIDAIETRYANKPLSGAKTIYIDPMLKNMPLSIGDRSDTIQDIPVALQGARFDLQSDEVYLFMQWGQGAYKGGQKVHWDMDLWATAVAHNKSNHACGYRWTNVEGMKHSGDVQYIEHKDGAAEYVKINVPVLKKMGYEYVCFSAHYFTSCGGYDSNGVTIGWMDSKNKISTSKSGLVYDPSCVQHMVRTTKKATGEMCFGVLDINANQIVWLEMFGNGLTGGYCKYEDITAMIGKLSSKFSVYNMLMIKAKAQNLTIVDSKDVADEVYTMEWAIDAAAVSKEFLA